MALLCFCLVTLHFLCDIDALQSLGLKQRLSQLTRVTDAFATSSTLAASAAAAAAEDAPETRAQTLGPARPRDNGAGVRVGVVLYPNVVVDGRGDLKRDMI